MSEIKNNLKCGMRQAMHNGNNALEEFRNGNLSRGKLIDILIDSSGAEFLYLQKDGEVDSLHEELAGVYIELSGKSAHSNSCATSQAPADKPGRCDCDCT